MRRTDLSPRSSAQFRPFNRFVLPALLLILLAGTASAYTIVLRDGRRIEVNSDFSLTKTTFTYEVAPGISKTLQLILIDVAATERANNEAPGKFFQHSAAISNPPAQASASHAQRTLSNRDLESIRQRRIESEENYERRRIELGLPSVEETRRRQAEEGEAMLALARRRAAEDANNEAFWRQRASALRSEIAAVDAEISYLRSRNGFAPTLLSGVIPFVSVPGRSVPARPRMPSQGTMAAPGPGAPNRALIDTGVAALRSPRAPRAFLNPGFPFQQFGYLNNSYQRYGVSDSLENLLVRRAGLESLWRELENDARREKVPQVWLEP
jgi:hypothetical protein